MVVGGGTSSVMIDWRGGREGRGVGGGPGLSSMIVVSLSPSPAAVSLPSG